MVAVGRRFLPRGWADFGLQLAIWFAFVFAYQLARGVANRESPERAFANGWRMDDVVSAAEIVNLIDAEFPIQPAEANYRGEVAKRWRYKDGRGEIGIIASVTQPFCGDCTRSRISAEGKLYTCLFAVRGHDLRALIRSGATDEQLAAKLAEIWHVRGDRYSELRSQNTVDPAIGERRVEMSYIGG